MRFVEPPRARRPSGALVVLHGLHYLGPDDARLDRFLVSLAEYGFLVAAPYLNSFMELVPQPGVVADASAAVDALRAHPRYPSGVKPGVVSISFGSLPALRMAAGPRRGDLGAVVCFGGYADWQASMRFAVSGAPGRATDPRNQPAVYLNLLNHIEDAPRSAALKLALRDAIFGLIRVTWGATGKWSQGRFVAQAKRARALLPDELTGPFSDATGIAPESHGKIESAIECAARDLSWLDPRSPDLKNTTVPLCVVHGREDDVIPVEQARLLAQACPAGTQVLLTGLYQHADRAILPPWREALEEGSVLLRVLRKLIIAGQGTHSTHV